MGTLVRRYERNFMAYELLLSMAVTGGAVLFVEFFWGRERLFDLLNGERQLWYSTVATIAGSLLGFVITALSVLFALTQADRYALLRRSPYYRQVYEIYISCVMFLGMATLIGLAGLFGERGQPGLAWLPYATGWAVIISTLRVYRCVWILWRVIRIAI